MADDTENIADVADITRAVARLDVSDLTPYLAGQIGQASLDRLAGVAHPELDQHVAAVRDAASAVLVGQYGDPVQLIGFLVRYASGFVAAATAGGWRPGQPGEHLDWESMRLAAVGKLAGQLDGSVAGPTGLPGWS